MSAEKVVRRLAPLAPLLAALAALAAPQALAAATTSTQPGPPKASTGAAGAVRGASATLFGAIDAGNQATSYHFEYGPTIAYGKQTTAGSLPAGGSRVKIGQAANGIIAGYHYRLVATNASGTSYGKDRIFTTKKHGKSGFTIAKTMLPTVYGSTYVLSGTLSGTANANRPVALQASPYPFLEPFAAIGLPARTDAGGRFSFRVPSMTQSTQLRIATLDARPAYSRIVTQDVAVKVTLKVRSSGHRGLVRLYGTVTPAKPGAHLDFQLFKQARPGNSPKAEDRTAKYATQFSTLVKRGTATVSRFSAFAKIRRGGAYRAYVDLPSKGVVVSGFSQSILLHAAPAASRRSR